MSKTLNLLKGTWDEDKTALKKKSPEAAVGRQVDTYLESLGCYIRTIKSDGTKDKNMRGGWRKSAQGSGISDRIGIMRFGRFIAVELKAPGKKRTTTESQFRFLIKIIERGGVGCIADSVACVKLAIGQSKAEMMKTLLSFKPVERIRDASELEPLFP